MHIMIIGGAGMVGAKLAKSLAGAGTLGDAPVDKLTLVDVVAPRVELPDGPQVELREADLSDPKVAKSLVDLRPDVIYHLAAIVSGEAESDFDKGYRINLDGTRYLFDAIRHAHGQDGYRPRMIFTSSIAVFGAPFPDSIPDDYFRTPQTSYGTQKAISELLLEDYTRRAFFDGLALRLPTICIRPGKPNLAASGFFSNILREPLAGQEAVLPVPDSVRHWHSSPRAVVRNLVRAGAMDLAPLGHRRSISLPGLSATVAEQIEALRDVAGDKAVALIRSEPDETIQRIVAGWPQRFETARARELGFSAESDFREIIAVHLEDELGTTVEDYRERQG
ncbi:D-erythronate dehydrogenase [Sulfitobacter sp. D35]|uniref:D-erythronate dehydrogenase n=1 Tax=Sulfitobacter sp. D35 TaxID=3083252 RepID=UPI00296E5359|nr:D-erythronate dehydrogenase [Sulfitobacter sp. D35]MDW4496966.1 D-erythronate dehydrogenase [Sulfitobacter sp. D35]